LFIAFGNTLEEWLLALGIANLAQLEMAEVSVAGGAL